MVEKVGVRTDARAESFGMCLAREVDFGIWFRILACSSPDVSKSVYTGSTWRSLIACKAGKPAYRLLVETRLRTSVKFAS